MKIGYGHELGKTNYQDIKIMQTDRLKSTYVIGSSGSGKSSLMENCICQDVHNPDITGSVFDVEERLSERTLRHLSDAGREPLVIDPTVGPVPFNILSVPPGIHPYTVIEGVLQAFKRAWWDSWGPRLEDLLRHCLMLLQEHQLTLGELTHLLSNQAWRERAAEASIDPRVRGYFLDHLKNISQRETRVWVESTRNKVAAFMDNPFIAPMLSADGCIDLLDVMDNQWLVVNLSERVLGDSGRLLGMLIVSRLYQAALRRKPGARPHIIYADEFQTIASKSFIDLVTRCRKRGVGAVIAHQTVSQPPFDKNPDFLSALLSNCATHVVMQVGRDDAERFAREIFPASGTEAKRRAKHWIWGDYGPPQFYSVNEEREGQYLELEGQKPRECFVKIRTKDGYKVFVAEAYEVPEPETQDVTITLPELPPTPDRLSRFTARRRRAVDNGG